MGMRTKALVLILLVAVAASVAVLSSRYQNTEPGTVTQYQSEDNHKTAVLFFDDARVSQYNTALPLQESQYDIGLLRKFGFHATFAIIVGSVDSPGFFTKEQLRELYADGMEIASHTVSHVHLSELSPEELRHELVDSKMELEAVIHAPVSTLILPFDDPLTPQVEKAIIDAGYSSIRPINGTHFVYGQNETEVYGWLERTNGTVLLTYHQIHDYTGMECQGWPASWAGKCATPPTFFKDEMEFLHTHGYHVISWRECLSTGCLHFNWPIPRDQLSSSVLPADNICSTSTNGGSDSNCQRQLGQEMSTLPILYGNRRSFLYRPTLALICGGGRGFGQALQRL